MRLKFASLCAFGLLLSGGDPGLAQGNARFPEPLRGYWMRDAERCTRPASGREANAMIITETGMSGPESERRIARVRRVMQNPPGWDVIVTESAGGTKRMGMTLRQRGGGTRLVITYGEGDGEIFGRCE